MFDHVAPVAVASPCVGVCVIDDGSGWCEGCGRTLDEIAAWLVMTPAERGGVMATLPERMAALRA